jgi:frataxin-like iron-binding protein CyaY
VEIWSTSILSGVSFKIHFSKWRDLKNYKI